MTAWQPHTTFDGVIDVSHFQGNISWSAVKDAGITLTFIKATQGSDDHDPLFATNYADAVAAGLMAVPYHFLDSSPVQKQVANFRFVTKLAANMPVMVDWEVEPKSNIRAPMELMRAFCTVVQAIIKRDPLAYHGMYDLSSPTINAFPWMIPKYGPQPQGPKWLFWQFTPTATVAGIPHAVDRSQFAGDANELEVWYKRGTLPQGF